MVTPKQGIGKLLRLVVLITFFGIAHHIDHIIRSNHIGWPLTPKVTSFSYSLGFYPLIFLGFYLTRKNKVGPAYWSILAAVGAIFVGLTHLGQFALEPPQDIINAYASPTIGWSAFAVLIVFLVSLIFASLYAGYLWVRLRKQKGS